MPLPGRMLRGGQRPQPQPQQSRRTPLGPQRPDVDVGSIAKNKMKAKVGQVKTGGSNLVRDLIEVKPPLRSLGGQQPTPGGGEPTRDVVQRPLGTQAQGIRTPQRGAGFPGVPGAVVPAKSPGQGFPGVPGSMPTPAAPVGPPTGLGVGGFNPPAYSGPTYKPTMGVGFPGYVPPVEGSLASIGPRMQNAGTGFPGVLPMDRVPVMTPPVVGEPITPGMLQDTPMPQQIGGLEDRPRIQREAQGLQSGESVPRTRQQLTDVEAQRLTAMARAYGIEPTYANLLSLQERDAQKYLEDRMYGATQAGGPTMLDVVPGTLPEIPPAGDVPPEEFYGPGGGGGYGGYGGYGGGGGYSSGRQTPAWWWAKMGRGI